MKPLISAFIISSLLSTPHVLAAERPPNFIFKGGKAPQRDSFYWELHESGRPIQAARFGKWKAVRNGTDKPIEIYDLNTDAAEAKNLAESRPDLVKEASGIFTASHRPDPHWPLDRLSLALKQSREEAWKITTERRKAKWTPENTKPLAE